MAYYCIAKGCNNGSRKLKTWKNATCTNADHADKNNSECGCEAPFTLWPFPTRKKQPELRDKWIKIVNRVHEEGQKLISPKKDSRVCSLHFANKKPTSANPLPTLNLGYNAERKARNLYSPEKSQDSDNKSERQPKNNKKWSLFTNIIFFLVFTKNVSAIIHIVRNLLLEIAALKRQLNDVKLQKKKKTPVFEKLLKNDEACVFYTNIVSLELFNKLHDFICPYVQKRFVIAARTTTKATGRTGRPRKLHSKDEFLLMLIKLRLGNFNQQLADIFDIGTSTCSDILASWIRATAECLSCVVFQPDESVLREVAPCRFGKYSDTVGIIDCSEIFIETPSNLELQAATWSDYKHHNTMKFLISVAPNSLITFISEPYTGRCSDKQVTADSKFLNTIPPQTRIMADKGFSLHDECAQSSIFFTVPPGRRGASQMTPSELLQTSDIAKLRILVEQVIQRMKTFSIIGNEFQIKMLPHLKDILVICAALCNFRPPIMVD